MTVMKTREEVTPADRPPILEVLPAALHRDAAPVRCVCRRCAPNLSDVQRAAHERVQEDWRATRIAWCEAHGYQLLDLIEAENEAAAERVRRRKVAGRR